MPSVAPKHRQDDDDDEEVFTSPATSRSGSIGANKRARLERRNGRVLPRGRSGTIDDDDEEEHDSEEDDVASFSGNILPAADVDPDEEEDLYSESEYERDLGPDSHDFQTGAIVRIKVGNFVTYSGVEIFPGPSLNMIIGPNGTGKSTIVCAICLGLGWKPDVLGRTKEVCDFVKYGTKEAMIEIELKGEEGKKNHVIRRKILRDGNQSTWNLNGKPSTLSKVQKLCRGLNIQVDNLCQFLPQDRVANFAALPPIERLKETQRAAAPAQMSVWHEDLKDLSKKLQGSHIEVKQNKEQVRMLEAKQAFLKQDVDRMREREDVMQRIKTLEQAKPFVDYRLAREKSSNAKAKARAAKQALDQLERESGPAMEEPRKKEKYRDALDNAATPIKAAVKDKLADASKIGDRLLPKLEEDIKDAVAKMDSERKAEQKRRDEVAKLKDVVKTLTKKLEKGPPDYDLSELNSQLQANSSECRSLEGKSNALQDDMRPGVERCKELDGLISQAKRRIQNLESVAGQREEMLKKLNKDAYTAWMWYKDNKDMFEHEIYGPPILNCTIEPKALAVAETLVGRLGATTFTCQSYGDLQKFTQHIFGRRDQGNGLSLADVAVKEFSNSKFPTFQDQTPIFPSEKIHELGFDGYPIDFIKGPDPVLNMLCNDHALNQCPISFNGLPSETNKACEERMSLWISGKFTYSVKRRYGAVSVAVQPIRRNNLFGAPSSDPEQIRQIKRSISEMQYEWDETDKSNRERQRELKEVTKELSDMQSERRKIEEEKRKKQQARSEYARLQAQLDSKKSDLEVKQQSGGDYKRLMEELYEKRIQAAAKKAKAAIEYAELTAQAVHLSSKFNNLHLRYIEAASDVQVLERKNERIIQQIAAKHEQAKHYHGIYEREKKSTIEKKEICSEISQHLDEHSFGEIYHLSEQHTLDEIDQELEGHRARLSLIHASNPNAIRMYEEREVQLQKLRADGEQMESALAGLQSEIDEIRGKWEPELEKLVEKISVAFSKNFEKIGCAGEVRVHKSDEGFEKWAIDILVKFRQTEKLQVLDNHRQSGGERAVSTIFYLMALQSLAKSPFRVVDEINQGMDPRNERTVHHRMVNVACQEHTSQYFLITPKLLNDLKYHPRAKLHCIYSGDWVQEGSVMDYGKYITIGQSLKEKAAAAGRRG